MRKSASRAGTASPPVRRSRRERGVARSPRERSESGTHRDRRGRSLRGLRDRRVSVLFVRGCWLGLGNCAVRAVRNRGFFAKRTERVRVRGARRGREAHLRRVPWERASWQSSGDVHWPSGAFTYSPSRPNGKVRRELCVEIPSSHRTGAQNCFLGRYQLPRQCAWRRRRRGEDYFCRTAGIFRRRVVTRLGRRHSTSPRFAHGHLLPAGGRG